jgi:hypothetical protein
MTADGFRNLALALPETRESAHLDHPDFRVGKRVFATLGYPDASWGMVKLTPSQQAEFVTLHPQVFVPVKGGWGLRGSTQVKLRTATRAVLWPAILAAWQNHAATTVLKRNAGLILRMRRLGSDHPPK